MLRIENPDTHEVLDLSGMPGNKPKRAEDVLTEKTRPAADAAAKPAAAVAPAVAATAQPVETAAGDSGDAKVWDVNSLGFGLLSYCEHVRVLRPCSLSEHYAWLLQAGAAWGGSKSFKEVIMVDPKIEEARKAEEDERKAAEAKAEEERKRAQDAKIKEEQAKAAEAQAVEDEAKRREEAAAAAAQAKEVS